MKSFIAVSRANRQSLNSEIEVILGVLEKFKIETLIFVDKQISIDNQEEKLMNQVFEIIDNCDLFIAELSLKAIGVGIEAGYAKAKNKTIIYIKDFRSKVSKTLKGTSDFIIEYHDLTDLEFKLSGILKKIGKGTKI